MTEQALTFTRRRVLGSLLTVGTASAAAGAGTMAAFSDVESSSGNTVQAGTLDLALDGADQTVTFLDVSGIQPGDSGSSSVTLGNTGTLAGDLEVDVAAIRDHENGFYGKESGQDGTSSDGELDDYLELRATIGTATVWPRQTVSKLTVGATYSPNATITGGGTGTFTLEWWLPTDTTDIVQSDSVELDLTFRLVQRGGA